MMPRVFPVGMLVVALAGCNGASGPTQTIRAPKGDYELLIEKWDRGACCKTRIVGHVAGFAEGKSVEVFEIRGSQEMSVAWPSPYAFVVTVCDASEITYKPRLWGEGLTNSVRIELINRQPRKSADGVTCGLPAISSR